MDEKKIEEAARKRLNAFRKANHDGYSSSIIDIESDCLDNFKAGAHWAIQEFLKGLWHPASEKPIMSEYGMIIVELNDITALKYSLWRSTTTYECLCNNKGYIHRWLYLDDLLQK